MSEVCMRSYETQALAEIIRAGRMTPQELAVCKRVFEENRQLEEKLNKAESDNRTLKALLKMSRDDRKAMCRDRIEAYRMVLEKEADYHKWHGWRLAIGIGLFALGGLTVAIATVAIVL